MTRKGRWILVLSITVPAAILAGVAAIVIVAQSPATFAATGTVTLSQVQDKTCAGTYDGIRSGAQVKVTDPDGKVVAVGQLGKARATADQAKTPFGGQEVLIGDTICEFPWSAPNIPAGKVSYGVTIATRPMFQATEDELRRGLKLK